ncbi:hypothetical protein ABZY42_01925 [Streptomyces sp. NPDC006622]|uniref:hypothetical protein n=1 Tax=Streptomyces sp. NPDC006622 TaxID=3155459 RepID=UPI0033B9B633
MPDVTSGGEFRRAAQEQDHDHQQERPRVVPLGETQGQGQGHGPGASAPSPAAGTATPAAAPVTTPAAAPVATPAVDPVEGGREPGPARVPAGAPGGLPAGGVEDGGGIGTAPASGAAHRTREAEGSSLLPHDECDKLSSRMRHAVAGFVDRPRDSVEEADQVLEDLATRFTEAVNDRRRTLRGSWQLADGKKNPAAATADTEQLRLALRDYRELTDRLLHL